MVGSGFQANVPMLESGPSDRGDEREQERGMYGYSTRIELSPQLVDLVEICKMPNHLEGVPFFWYSLRAYEGFTTLQLTRDQVMAGVIIEACDPSHMLRDPSFEATGESGVWYSVQEIEALASYLNTLSEGDLRKEAGFAHGLMRESGGRMPMDRVIEALQILFSDEFRGITDRFFELPDPNDHDYPEVNLPHAEITAVIGQYYRFALEPVIDEMGQVVPEETYTYNQVMVRNFLRDRLTPSPYNEIERTNDAQNTIWFARALASAGVIPIAPGLFTYYSDPDVEGYVPNVQALEKVYGGEGAQHDTVAAVNLIVTELINQSGSNFVFGRAPMILTKEAYARIVMVEPENVGSLSDALSSGDGTFDPLSGIVTFSDRNLYPRPHIPSDNFTKVADLGVVNTPTQALYNEMVRSSEWPGPINPLNDAILEALVHGEIANPKFRGLRPVWMVDTDNGNIRLVIPVDNYEAREFTSKVQSASNALEGIFLGAGDSLSLGQLQEDLRTSIMRQGRRVIIGGVPYTQSVINTALYTLTQEQKESVMPYINGGSARHGGIPE